jgi:type VI secretion system secreted protein VgrG
MSDGTSLPDVEFDLTIVDGGDDAGWRPVHLHQREHVSRPYECSVVLASTQLDADIDALFEKNVGVEIIRASLTRGVRGWVKRVEDLGTTGSYRFARVLVAPQLWKLSHRVNSRMWQQVNIITILRELLRDAGIYQGNGGLVVGGGLDQLPAREYCVQYRETDLDFLQRLLQEEGVTYYFRHEGAVETLVLAEEGHAWQVTPTLDGGAVQALDAGVSSASAESVQWFDWHRRSHTTGVVLRDFDFTHPRAFLDFTAKAPSDGGARPVYDYPARYNLGEYHEGGHAYGPHHGVRTARVRNEELRFDERAGHGRSNVTGFMPGLRVDLDGHLRAGTDGAWVLLGVEHEGIAWGDIPDETRTSEHMRAILKAAGAHHAAESSVSEGRYEARYSNSFIAVPGSVQIRPARETPRPLVHGPQTATVMAEPGSDDEICVDFHGRILVRFHWERPELRPASQRGKSASCWIRVAQTWAGAQWGTMFIPRVGMEVVVTFLEGDPDRPLVTGCVYNGENHVPYNLPEEKTKSTIKTSTSPGGDGFNELRFEDLKDREQIFIHAQRDMDRVVRRNDTLIVGNDRQKTIQGNERITVVKDRTSEVQGDERFLVQGDRNERVNGGKGYALNVVNHLSINADKSMKLTVGSSSIEVLPDKITIASKTVHVLGKSLVNINGGLVKINCGDDPGGAKADKGDVEAAKPLEMMGEKGDLLSRIKDLLNPTQLAETAGRSLDRLLASANVPERIRERLGVVARNAVGELVTAVKEGRRPNFKKIAGLEDLITTAVGAGVDAVFKRIESAPAVKNSKFLSGLVKEAKGVSKTAASYGVLHAAGLHEGMAKDPFWSVIRNRHGESVKSFLRENGMGAASQVVNGFVDRLGNIPLLEKNPKLREKIVGFLNKAAERGVNQGVDRVLGLIPSGA